MDAKIYKVTFKEPVNGKTDYVFGSLSAIYTKFGKEQIGCKVENLWNKKITEWNPYIGRKCAIAKETLLRKKKTAK